MRKEEYTLADVLYTTDTTMCNNLSSYLCNFEFAQRHDEGGEIYTRR